MKNLNADMDVLFALFGMNDIENEFVMAVGLAVLAAFAACGLILWLRRGERAESGNIASREKTGADDKDDAAKKGTLKKDSFGGEPSRDRAVDGYVRADAIVGALGGTGNIYNLRTSDTRLRVTVNDGALVDRRRLKATGALGILAKGRQVQVFYEDQVEKICRELARYIDGHRKVDVEQEAGIDYERVLKKVYVPVEGDVVRVSDICGLYDMADGGVGNCAVRAARGEIRAPFDCKVGYSAAGEGEIECVSEERYRVRLRLLSCMNEKYADGTVIAPINVRLMCSEGEMVRKGRLLAEYPYETHSELGEEVYALIDVYAPDGMDECCLKVNRRENVNYEYVACEVVK